MKLPTNRSVLKQPDIYLVGPDNVPKFRGELERLLDPANKYYSRYFNLEDIIEKARQGKFQIWFAREQGVPFFCMVTEILIYPKSKVLSILQIGGDELRGFHVNMDYVENWARMVGCTHVETQCRDGIAKLLERQGYKKRAVTISKYINPVKDKEH